MPQLQRSILNGDARAERRRRSVLCTEAAVEEFNEKHEGPETLGNSENLAEVEQEAISHLMPRRRRTVQRDDQRPLQLLLGEGFVCCSWICLLLAK